MTNEPSNPTSAAAETASAPRRDAQVGDPASLGETPMTADGTAAWSETGNTLPDGGMPQQPGDIGSGGAGAIAEKPDQPGASPDAAGSSATAQADATGEPGALPEAIRQKLLTAEIRSVGAELGLIDAEAALRLMPPEAVTVSAQGDVTGVREALTALQQRKGYLFARAARGAWAQRMGDSAPRLTGVEEAFYRKNPTLKK